MPFVEDPVHLSKSRLKSDLVAHSVALPPEASKKEVYVELHLKHVEQKNATDFSSDEEDQARDVADKEEDPEDAEMPDPSSLTDDDLRTTLLKHRVKAGPIVASTRALYERKLRKLLRSDRHDRLNGAEKTELYSDSEEEEEEEEENGEEDDKESGSEQQTLETAEQLYQAQQESSQAKLHFQNSGFSYPQCFLPSSRLRAHPPRDSKPSSKWNSRNALKSSERSRSHCSQIPIGISIASSIDQHSGLGSGVPSGSQSKGCSSFSSQAFSITQMVEEEKWFLNNVPSQWKQQMDSRSSLSATKTDAKRELNGSNVQEHWSRSSRLPREPVKDIFKDIFPDTETIPTGIYATCRKPIKGAALRPVQYEYPDTPLSPMTLESREVERRLVPIQIQIMVFLTVACFLYFIYINVEDSSLAVLALLDSLNQGSDSEEGRSPQADTHDTQVIAGQD